jgi:hypothetical protein
MGTKPDLSRVRERPDPESWGEDELITLAEAAELFWPKGPLRSAPRRCAPPRATDSSRSRPSPGSS